MYLVCQQKANEIIYMDTYMAMISQIYLEPTSCIISPYVLKILARSYCNFQCWISISEILCAIHSADNTRPSMTLIPHQRGQLTPPVLWLHYCAMTDDHLDIHGNKYHWASMFLVSQFKEACVGIALLH